MRTARVLLPLLVVACSGENGTTDVVATTSGTEGTGGSTDVATSTPTSSSTDTGLEPTSTGPGPVTDATGTDTGTDTTSDISATSTTGTSTTDTSTTDTSTTTETTSTGTTDPSDTSTGERGCSPDEFQACYSGPPGTEDVGTCVAGLQGCMGGVFGACVGEVLPAADTCATPGDESCDGLDPCVGDGEFQWFKTFGAAGEEMGVRLAFDGAGNLVLAARGTSTLDFGGGPLVSAGGYDLFLARFDPAGKHLWSKRFGDFTQQFDDGYALALDPAGGIAVAGDFSGTIDFGGGPLTAKNVGDPFIARFTADGAHVWSKAFKTGSYAYPRGLAFDPDGNLLVGGYFFVSLDLGGGVMTSAGMVDAFVGKLDGNGAHLWSQRFGDAQGQYVHGLVVDASGDVVIGGGFTGSVDFGVGVLTSAGTNDVFLARLDPTGNAVWSRRFGDSKDQVLRDLAIDGAGRLVAVGETQGLIDLGGGPIGAASSRGFIGAFDGAGNHAWSHLVGTTSLNVQGVAFDGPGAVLVTGDFSGTSDFGGGALVSAGTTDIYVVKLGADGSHVWSQRFGDFASQIGYDIAGSSTGRVGVTGSFSGGINFGGGPVNSQGGNDGFLTVFSP